MDYTGYELVDEESNSVKDLFSLKNSTAVQRGKSGFKEGVRF